MSIPYPSREELGDNKFNMAKAYESFKNDEIKTIYRFMCRINEFNLISVTTDKSIKRFFPNSRDWEAAIGMENICCVNIQDLQANPGNPHDKRYKFVKGSRTTLNALLYTITTAISLGSIEKSGKNVIITLNQGGNLIADGIIPFENFKSFINLF